MAASVHGVRDKVDAILGQLDRSEDEARAAALAVGDQIRLHGLDEAEGEPGDAVVADAAAAVAQTGGDAGEAPTDPEAPGTAPSVDELFARIRAGSDTETPGDGVAGQPRRRRPRRPRPRRRRPRRRRTGHAGGRGSGGGA